MNKEIEILPIYFDWLIDKKYPVNVLVGGRNSGKSFFMEQLATINTHNGEKYTLLVIEDIETNTYKKHMEQFGNTMIIPGESIFDLDGINGIARFIRGVMEA